MTARRRPLIALLLVTLAIGLGASTAAVAQPDVRIANVTVSPTEPFPGETVTFEITIANLDSSADTVDVTDLFIRSAGSAQTRERVENVGSIAPGNEITVRMTGSFGNTGSKELTVRATVRDGSGNFHTYEYPVYVDVVEPQVRAGLSTSDAANGSDGTTVTLTNYGNANLTNVELTAAADGEVLARQYVLDVEPGASRSAVFDDLDSADGPVTFTATYDAAGATHNASVTDAVEEQVLGEIRLTGVETTRTGSHLSIQGEAANVGSTDTESVLVAVRNESGIRPASPYGEYFIGAVEASEFATFELTADVPPDAASVPVEISYIVDGERVTRTQRVDLGSSNGSSPARSPEDLERPARGGSGGLLGSPVVLVVVLLALGGVGFAVYRWRGR